MTPILEIFAPYLTFIIALITILLNVFLIYNKIEWLGLIIANVLLLIIVRMAGLEEYSFLEIIVTETVIFIKDILTEIFMMWIDWLVEFYRTLGNFIVDLLTGLTDWIRSINPFTGWPFGG